VGKHEKLRSVLFFLSLYFALFRLFLFHFVSSSLLLLCVACITFLRATLVHLTSQKYVIAYLVLVCARLDNW